MLYSYVYYHLSGRSLCVEAQFLEGSSVTEITQHWLSQDLVYTRPVVQCTDIAQLSVAFSELLYWLCCHASLYKLVNKL